VLARNAARLASAESNRITEAIMNIERSAGHAHTLLFPRDGELCCGGIEAEVIQGEGILTISELGTDGLHVMLDRRQALALRAWLTEIL
jgi:hypothetical protein